MSETFAQYRLLCSHVERAGPLTLDRIGSTLPTLEALTPDLPAGQCHGVLAWDGAVRGPKSSRKVSGKVPCEDRPHTPSHAWGTLLETVGATARRGVVHVNKCMHT